MNDVLHDLLIWLACFLGISSGCLILANLVTNRLKKRCNAKSDRMVFPTRPYVTQAAEERPGVARTFQSTFPKRTQPKPKKSTANPLSIPQDL
jgi:hypothetical protein